MNQENKRSIQIIESNRYNIHWFPMSITSGKIDAVCNELENHGVEYILPSRDVVSNYIIPDSSCDFDLTHIIFIQSCFYDIMSFKHETSSCRYLRFLMTVNGNINRRYRESSIQMPANSICVIPDEDIEIYKKVVSCYRDSLTLMLYSDKFKIIGKNIEITQGPLCGILAKVRRINKNKHVFFDCGELITLQLSYLPQTMYRVFEDISEQR